MSGWETYSKWVAENPTCCEYCFDQWLTDQAHAERDAPSNNQDQETAT